MLQKNRSIGKARGDDRFVIVASRYNTRYVDGMLRAAQAAFVRAGVPKALVVRVPGAFEIPVVAARLAEMVDPAFSAVVCLGVILRGATSHAQHIGDSVSRALAEIQIRTKVPVIHEVLLLENEDQARMRCLSKEHNRGAEAAATAVEMAGVMRSLARRGRVKIAENSREGAGAKSLVNTD